jgi:hypothetical protein
LATGEGTVALGNASSAIGQSALAIGNMARANGAGAIAVGEFASASGTNSIALGAGATADQPNEIALGTVGSTYSAPGLTGASSRASQSGATQFVTTDSAANLSAAGFGPAEISNLFEWKAGISSEVASLKGDIRRANAGVALAMAMGGTVIPPGTTMALSFNLAPFRGEQGFSGAFVGRITRNIWVNASAAIGTGGSSSGGRAGFTIGW